MGKIIIEADGVLRERIDINKPLEFMEEDYFLLRTPEWNVLGALKAVLDEDPDAPIEIIEKIPYEIPKAMEELKMWYSNYLPNFDKVKFLPYGEYIGSYTALSKDDILISSSIRDVALFIINEMAAIGVDVDNDALKGMGFFSTNNSRDEIYQYFKMILSTMEGNNIKNATFDDVIDYISNKDNEEDFIINIDMEGGEIDGKET